MARVLVVDDDEVMNRTLVRVPRWLGLDVAGTSSPLAALEMTTADPPDLGVADYDMPEMNGIMMVNQMVGALGDRCPPVLFVSGSPIPNMLARVPPKLHTSFIAKPFDLEDLEREVKSLLAA